MILDAAKRVSLVTAVSPRALVDVAYVVFEAGRLIRRLAELYGGRPGTLGFFRLARNVLAHLAVTGSIAVGDSFVQQIVGHGLAARLSAKLGEGVVNGMMTARIGIAAMETARPLPFSAAEAARHGRFPVGADLVCDAQGGAGKQPEDDLRLAATRRIARSTAHRRSINQSCSWSDEFHSSLFVAGCPSMKRAILSAVLPLIGRRGSDCRHGRQTVAAPNATRSSSRSVEGEWAGPGEIVAGKYKGTKFTCNFTGSTPAEQGRHDARRRLPRRHVHAEDDGDDRAQGPRGLQAAPSSTAPPARASTSSPAMSSAASKVVLRPSTASS